MRGGPSGTKGEKVLTDVILGNKQDKEDVSEKACNNEINDKELTLVRLFKGHVANFHEGMADELSKNKVENMDDKEKEKNPSGNKQAIVMIEEEVQALDAQLLTENEKVISVFFQPKDPEWQADGSSSGWVLQNIQKFSKMMSVSLDGMED